MTGSRTFWLGVHVDPLLTGTKDLVIPSLPILPLLLVGFRNSRNYQGIRGAGRRGDVDHPSKLSKFVFGHSQQTLFLIRGEEAAT